MIRLVFSFLSLTIAARAGTPEAMSLLKTNCFSCHNPEKKKGKLDLTTRESLFLGGKEGQVVVPGKSAVSRLIHVLQAGADPHMPPKDQLSPRAIATFEAWIDDGAQWDAGALKDRPDPGFAELKALPTDYSPVLCIALAPDGKRLAAGRGNKVVVFDLSQGNKVLATLKGHRDAVRSLAWSSDGKMLASGGYRSVRLWNDKWKQEREIKGFEGRVTGLVFAPDNKSIFAADSVPTRRGMVHRWKLADGTKLAGWRTHNDSVFSLAVSTDGKRLATAGGDKVAKVWDLPSGKEAVKIEGHDTAIYGVAFNKAGTELSTISAGHELIIWDLKTKQRLTSFQSNTGIKIHKGSVNAMQWNSERKTIVTACSDGKARVFTNIQYHDGAASWKAADEKILESVGGTLHCVAASQDVKLVVAGGQKGEIFIWRGDTLSATLKPETKKSAEQSHLSFIRDILPILSKAGCNAGGCHAKPPEGQNGFQLSIFSYDPKRDWREIVEDARGRRVFPGFPDESLFVKKPTLALAHEGGQRILPGSDSHKSLLRWIQEGMLYKGENEPLLAKITVQPDEGIYAKGKQISLKSMAHFSDGSTRDVTSLTDFVSNQGELAEVDEHGHVKVGQLNGEATIMARYMGQVGIARITIQADKKLPAEKYAALPRNNFIDELSYAHFERLGLFPSGLCTDADFLRRASLDTLGRLPTVSEAKTFLNDPSPEKRNALIERLLKDHAYADHWANKWADLVRPNPDRAGLKSVYILDQWLREAFRENRPLDQFAREVVAATGSTHRVGPTVIYRDKRTPKELAKIFSQIFLGMRLECASCHNHPNEKWTQTDFFSFAAFWAQVKQKGRGVSPPISGATEWFFHGGKGEVKHPIGGAVLAPKPPGAPAAKIPAKSDPRHALVDWMTAPDNPFFAKAMVNRVWGAYFGRGIVEPVDDIRSSNPPVNPALLEKLARHFVDQKYDQKALIRTIMQSHVYQLSSNPNETNKGDTSHFSRSYRRLLGAEVLLDAVSDVTGVPETYDATWPGARALETWNFKISSEFMDAFGRPNSSSDPPCERNAKGNVVQSLHLMHSAKLSSWISNAKGRARRLATSKLPSAVIGEDLYLAAFSRRPNEKEMAAIAAYFDKHKANRQAATEDLMWVIINSAEFVMNH
jgi:WD40 repeat protein